MSTTQENIKAGITVAESVAVFLPPNIQLAIGLIGAASRAIEQAQAQGKDITDDALIKLFSLDDQAKAEDLAAQNKVRIDGKVMHKGVFIEDTMSAGAQLSPEQPR